MQIGPKIATLQEEKKQKWTLKNVFFSKIPQDFQLLKQVSQSSHQTGHFGPRLYIGALILSLSAFPSNVMCGKTVQAIWDLKNLTVSSKLAGEEANKLISFLVHQLFGPPVHRVR